MEFLFLVCLFILHLALFTIKAADLVDSFITILDLITFFVKAYLFAFLSVNKGRLGNNGFPK